MIQVALLLTKKYRLLSIAAILDVFETVNSHYESNGNPPFFKLNLFYSGEYNQKMAAFDQYNPKHLSESGEQNLILIPAFDTNNLSLSIPENKEFLPWLREYHQNGAEVASFCTGAFLLAASGLLNGKQATTHVNAATAFSAFFPEVILQPDAVVTEDNGVYTSGGATSTFHLLLRLIHHYCNRDLAIRIAKVFAIDMNREQQSYFGSFMPVRDHGDELVAKIQTCMENTYHESVSIDQLLQHIPSSRRNIIRRFKHATGNTLIEYLQKTRIEAAKKLLEQTNQSIMEVMLNTGYNDLKTFRLLFKKSSGMTPKDYRDKFKARVA